MPSGGAAESLPMPHRGVRGVARAKPLERASARTWLARVVAFGGAAAITVALTIAMAGAFSGSVPAGLGGLFIALFAVTVGWIAFSATNALAGLVLAPPRRWPEAAPEGRVALVMPVYNEDPAGTTAGLLAMGQGLVARGLGETFEIVVLSDTNDPEAWVRETAAIAWLRGELAGGMAVWYRRRARNTARKSGNVEEFVRRAGGRYTAFVMLDADSVMDPTTLETLARRMAGDPALGLLQTVPQLVDAEGALPRSQEFANAAYGPLVARGVAAWSGPDGNYWGHNAIIRSTAFAEACGLPELVGRRPFGGPILSHDFAEAAWMRRGGWSVRMDPDLGGSYEAGPPTLLDLVVRDRRWMQGNFQHAKIIGASGLSMASRFHLFNGIASYAASPMWLLLLVVGGAITVFARHAEHSYFAGPHQLTPDWPRFDAERMLLLFGITFAMLLLPKIVGTAQHVGRRLRAGRVGDALRLVVAAVVETLLSALYAPILMLTQTRQALEILRGRDAGWQPQSRAGETPWGVALRAHAGHTLVGLALTVVCGLWAPELLIWVSPIALGLVCSVPLSRLSGSKPVARLLGRSRLFEAPREGGANPPIVALRDALLPGARKAIEGVDLRSVLSDPNRLARHYRAVEPRQSPERGAPDLAWLGAREKCRDAESVEELRQWLGREDALALLMDEQLAAALLGKARRVRGPAAVQRQEHAVVPAASRSSAD